jgi:hypothetical protein
VSENVVIYGMPNGQILNYADWQQRRKNEFKKGLLKSISYDKLAVKNFGLRRLTFKVQEVMDCANDDLVIINKEIILELEDDEQWRVVEETIKNWKFLKSHQTN